MTPSQLKPGDWVGPWRFERVSAGGWCFRKRWWKPMRCFDRYTVSVMLTHYGGVSASKGGTGEDR